MPRGKPRYNAEKPFTELIKRGAKPFEFSPELRQQLTEIYGSASSDAKAIRDDWIQAFVDDLLREASWAVGEIENIKRGLSKADLTAECADLVTALDSAVKLPAKLHRMSPDLLRQLSLDVDPRAVAEKLHALSSELLKLSEEVEAVGARVGEMPRCPRPADQFHEMAVELAIRVLSVAKGYGLRVSATAGGHLKLGHDITADTGDGHSRYVSPTVRIMKVISDELANALSFPQAKMGETTWKEITSSAKREAPDLA